MKRVRMFTYQWLGGPKDRLPVGTLVTQNEFNAHKLAREYMVEHGACSAWLIGVAVAPYEIISKTLPDIGLVFRLLVERPVLSGAPIPIRIEDRDLAYIVEKRMALAANDLLPTLVFYRRTHPRTF